MTQTKLSSEDLALIETAKKFQGEFALTQNFSAASVASALLTHDGKTYTGICLELACGLGNCAEHSAILEMLKNRETKIAAIVAVNKNTILPPCGRCRELIAQLDSDNFQTRVILNRRHSVSLESLLPEHWIIKKEKAKNGSPSLRHIPKPQG